MTFRKALVASVMTLLVATTAAAQQQTGEIYGRAADKSGAVLPGATVTVAGPGADRAARRGDVGNRHLPRSRNCRSAPTR